MALTEIFIRVATDLRCPDIMLTEPYVYEWNSVIAQCHQLERFQFVHIFQGCLDVHPSSFGSQWASAFNIFADCTICTNLKAVLFLVEARALQEEDATTTEKNIRDREAFIGIFKPVSRPTTPYSNFRTGKTSRLGSLLRNRSVFGWVSRRDCQSL
ncbi:hypothetical protein NMY22_g469 [Coprinellus aureogranulatus]|nr:hypothetical protein NMY22_g469 [Coprinellus aureogranulatus]